MVAQVVAPEVRQVRWWHQVVAQDGDGTEWWHHRQYKLGGCFRLSTVTSGGGSVTAQQGSGCTGAKATILVFCVTLQLIAASRL